MVFPTENVEILNSFSSILWCKNVRDHILFNKYYLKWQNVICLVCAFVDFIFSKKNKKQKKIIMLFSPSFCFCVDSIHICLVWSAVILDVRSTNEGSLYAHLFGRLNKIINLFYLTTFVVVFCLCPSHIPWIVICNIIAILRVKNVHQSPHFTNEKVKYKNYNLTFSKTIHFTS